MAKINETILIVKVSELVKDDAVTHPVMDVETIASLEAVVKELAGGNALVEITAG